METHVTFTDAPVVGSAPVPRARRFDACPTPATMQAAVITAPGEVELASVPVPQPAGGEVRVRLEGCGVCGSNLAPWEGRPWFQYPLAPGQLGHEGWGRVDQVGPDVSRIKVGDRVAMLSSHAFAEYDIAPESAVVPLPEELDGQLFPGEALGCALNVFCRADIHAGHNVAIIGIGFLGSILTGLSALTGAKVLAISRRPFALKIARQMGAAHTIATGTPNGSDAKSSILDQANELTKGKGCDRVIEVVGRQWPLDLATELTCERGRLIIAGYHQDGSRQVNMQLWNWRGLDVINAHERDPAVYVEGIRAAVETVACGALDPSPLYTHTFPLARLGDALNAMKERPDGFLKALVTV